MTRTLQNSQIRNVSVNAVLQATSGWPFDWPSPSARSPSACCSSAASPCRRWAASRRRPTSSPMKTCAPPRSPAISLNAAPPIGHLVAQHLYVKDGDLDAQDRARGPHRDAHGGREHARRRDAREAAWPARPLERRDGRSSRRPAPRTSRAGRRPSSVSRRRPSTASRIATARVISTRPTVAPGADAAQQGGSRRCRPRSTPAGQETAKAAQDSASSGTRLIIIVALLALIAAAGAGDLRHPLGDPPGRRARLAPALAQRRRTSRSSPAASRPSPTATSRATVASTTDAGRRRLARRARPSVRDVQRDARQDPALGRRLQRHAGQPARADRRRVRLVRQPVGCLAADGVDLRRGRPRGRRDRLRRRRGRAGRRAPGADGRVGARERAARPRVPPP